MDATEPSEQTLVVETEGEIGVNRDDTNMDTQPTLHPIVASSPVNSEGSVLSDSDITNFSSANSTLKSDLSGTCGKQGRTSHQEAIATLDFFLHDVSQMTEKAKQEEEVKQQLAKNEPPPNQAGTKNKQIFRIGTSSTSSSILKRCSSMPSVVSDDLGELSYRMGKSLDDIRSIENDVFSDEESGMSAYEKKRKIHAQNKANNANISMSSQGSDALSPHSYGLTHLNHLMKFLEQFDHLQQQNSELTKRVTNLEHTFAKQAPPPTTSESAASSQRNSAAFIFPKDKPKKSKAGKTNKDKIKGKTKYFASLPFVLAAKSVDNLKHSSSQTLDKSKLKMARQKKVRSYAVDDLEIGKTLHTQEKWRNLSVKSPGIKDAQKRFSVSDLGKAEADAADPPLKREIREETIVPVVVVTEEATTSSAVDKMSPPDEPKPQQNPTGIKKVFPLKPASPPRAKSEERSYRNTKKMTEWGTLQQAFPVPQIESNMDLLNHLESMMTVHKKTTHHHGFKRGRSKKTKNADSKMYLPPTEIPGFASTFLAAHAMANQFTLALNLNDLELLTTQDGDDMSAPSGLHAVSIS